MFRPSAQGMSYVVIYQIKTAHNREYAVSTIPIFLRAPVGVILVVAKPHRQNKSIESTSTCWQTDQISVAESVWLSQCG